MRSKRKAKDDTITRRPLKIQRTRRSSNQTKHNKQSNHDETYRKEIYLNQPSSMTNTLNDEMINMENVRTSPELDERDICQVCGNLGHSRDCLAIPQSVNHITDADCTPDAQEALCPVCDQPTKDDSIECDQCERFVHCLAYCLSY